MSDSVVESLMLGTGGFTLGRFALTGTEKGPTQVRLQVVWRNFCFSMYAIVVCPNNIAFLHLKESSAPNLSLSSSLLPHEPSNIVKPTFTPPSRLQIPHATSG